MFLPEYQGVTWKSTCCVRVEKVALLSLAEYIYCDQTVLQQKHDEEHHYIAAHMVLQYAMLILKTRAQVFFVFFSEKDIVIIISLNQAGQLEHGCVTLMKRVQRFVLCANLP